MSRKKSPITSILLLALYMSSPAYASTDWQGPYIGAYLGGGFGSNHASTNAGTVTNNSYFTTIADIRAVTMAGTTGNNPNNVIGGIQVGNDWLWKQMIVGVAADYTLLPLNSSNRVTQTYPNNSNIFSVRTSMSTNWLFTLRGRMGSTNLLPYESLVYLTAGMAITQLKVTNNFSDNSALSGVGGNTVSQNQIGWTAGVGIELASFKSATLNIEYLYVDVPSVKSSSLIYNSAGGFGVPTHSLINNYSTTGKFHASLLKIGLNYRF